MKYRKKPIVIEAIQFTKQNISECRDFLGKDLISEPVIGGETFRLTIFTLEGNHTASLGDYLIRGVKGEHYPCKPDIFEMTYEKLEVTK